MKYQSGIDIHEGDRISYGGQPGEIEWVIEGFVGIPERDWLFQQSGAGVMVLVFGRVYLHDPEDDEALVFIERRKDS